VKSWKKALSVEDFFVEMSRWNLSRSRGASLSLMVYSLVSDALLHFDMKNVGKC